MAYGRGADLAMGIMSGTSADGIDAALIELDEQGRLEGAIAHRHVPYPDALRERVLAAASGEAGSAADVARLHGELGDRYADAATALMSETGARPAVIGVHGQTVAHLPGERVTLQLGDAARVAARTGVPTAADFRSADMAAGGEGAPLVPFADHLMFASRAPCVVLNLGGIANVTLIPDEERDHVRGFDTGPGNMVIDLIARLGGQRYDERGEGARRGRASEDALREALAHPYFRREPPKSTGREEFGEAFARAIVDGVRGSLEDALATATMLTARSVARATRAAGGPWREMLVAGGGARNDALMENLRGELAPTPVRPTDDAGIPAQAREAIAFAILAVYRLRGLPNTLPAVTGASRAVSAGALHLP